MRIVLDAMGSDSYPAPDVAGAVLAAREYNDTIILVGDEVQIKQELSKHHTSDLKIEIVHASDVILMTDTPSTVGKSKPQSSMHIGMKLLKDSQADAFVTAGNTGAALTIATLYSLRRISGVKRPALSSIVKVRDHHVIMLDIGANTDSRPEWLAQFAVMGDIYARRALGLQKPRIALLSNGEEEGKGNHLVHESHLLLSQLDLNFIGNIEPKEILYNGADVIISDGFVGNLVVKSFEAFGTAMFNLIRDEIRSDLISTVGGLLAQRAFRRVYKQIDPAEIGGAPLLGVQGVVIIAHGRSNAKAIKNAIRQARLAKAGEVVQAIEAGIQSTKP